MNIDMRRAWTPLGLFVFALNSLVANASNLSYQPVPAPVAAQAAPSAVAPAPAPAKRATQPQEGHNNYGDDDETTSWSARPECSKGLTDPILYLEHSNFLTFLDKGVVWQAVLNPHRCYKVGRTLNLAVFKLDRQVVYESQMRGSARVDAIEQGTLAELRSHPQVQLSDEQARSLTAILQSASFPSGASIRLVKLTSPQWQKQQRSTGAPMVHPNAQTVGKRELEALLASKTPIYDVRPANVFKITTIPGALNMPANKFGFDHFSIQGPTELQRLGLTWDVSSLPTNKTSPLLIFSSCPADLLSYNAVTYLQTLGYKKILWYRPGLVMYKHKKNLCQTPRSLDGVNPLEAIEVLALLKREAKLIFVEHVTGDSKIPRIEGAIPIIYKQKMRADHTPVLRKAGFSTEDLKKSGDSVDLSEVKFAKNSMIVVYGVSEFDWRALKLAHLLKLNGFTSVKWFRGGLANWLNSALFEPNLYKTTPPFVRK